MTNEVLNVEMDAALELAALRAELRALVDDASFSKGIKVVRAAKIADLLERASTGANHGE